MPNAEFSAFDVGRSTLGVRRFLPHETQTHRGDGIHGIDADRGRCLAARSLHCRTATTRARRLFHRRFSASAVQPRNLRSHRRVRLRSQSSRSIGAVFTTVANWSTSGLKDITWRGKKYLWSKSREFLRFVSAPKEAGETFGMATNIDETKTRRKFEQNSWHLTSPLQMSVDYWL